MQTVKLSTFDRLANFQQLAETNTIKRINKRLLQEQVISNLELDRLNQQLSQANAINRQILQNQIREIEQRETQKYYKDLSFKVRALIKAINQISEPFLKSYFINKHYEILKTTAFTAAENLIEIDDRMFNSTSVEEVESIKLAANKQSEEYKQSPLSQLDESIDNLNKLKAQSARFLPPGQELLNVKIKPKSNAIRMVGLIIFGLLTIFFCFAFIATFLGTDGGDFKIIATIFFALPLLIFLQILKNDIKWRKNYSAYFETQNHLLQSQINSQMVVNIEYKSKLSEFDTAISNHPSHIIYQKVITDFPDFDTTFNTVNDLFDRCFPHSSNLKKPSDKLLRKAAEIVIKYQQCSNPLLQRKLSIGKAHANKIITQLETLDIVELNRDRKSYRVIANDMSLDGILKEL